MHPYNHYMKYNHVRNTSSFLIPGEYDYRHYGLDGQRSQKCIEETEARLKRERDQALKALRNAYIMLTLALI